MVLKVVTTIHMEMADVCSFNLSGFWGRVYIETRI